MLDKSSLHRLIGAAIMLVAAVSVLPIILDGEKPANLGSSLTTPPPAPNITTVNVKPVQKIPVIQPEKKEIAKPKKTEKLEGSTKSASSTTSSTATKAQVSSGLANNAIQKPVKEKEVKAESIKKAVVVKKVAPKPVRWVVQIASFKNRNNAKDLVKKLQTANYAAYSVTTKTLYKVFVGPEIKKSRSNEIKQEIKKEFRLEGFVVKYSEN